MVIKHPEEGKKEPLETERNFQKQTKVLESI